jgi:hypothetical protein
MSQVTIYLNHNLERKMKRAAKASSLSLSKWITKIIEEKISSEWSQDIVDLAGSWEDDFPTLEEIRASYIIDAERENL